MSENYGYNPEEFEQFKVKKAIESKFPDKEEINESSEEAGSEENNALKKGKLETVEAHFKDSIYEQIDANQDFKQWDEEIAFLENPKIIPDKEGLLSIKKQILDKYKQVNQRFFSLGKERSRKVSSEQKNNNIGENLSTEFKQINQSYLEVRKQMIVLEDMLTRLDTVQEKHPNIFYSQLASKDDPSLEKIKKTTTELTEGTEVPKGTFAEQPKQNDIVGNIKERDDLQSSTYENKEKEIAESVVPPARQEVIDIKDSQIPEEIQKIITEYEADGQLGKIVERYGKAGIDYYIGKLRNQLNNIKEENSNYNRLNKLLNEFYREKEQLSEDEKKIEYETVVKLFEEFYYSGIRPAQKKPVERRLNFFKDKVLKYENNEAKKEAITLIDVMYDMLTCGFYSKDTVNISKGVNIKKDSVPTYVEVFSGESESGAVHNSFNRHSLFNTDGKHFDYITQGNKENNENKTQVGALQEMIAFLYQYYIDSYDKKNKYRASNLCNNVENVASMIDEVMGEKKENFIKTFESKEIFFEKFKDVIGGDDKELAKANKMREKIFDGLKDHDGQMFAFFKNILKFKIARDDLSTLAAFDFAANLDESLPDGVSPSSFGRIPTGIRDLSAQGAIGNGHLVMAATSHDLTKVFSETKGAKDKEKKENGNLKSFVKGKFSLIDKYRRRLEVDHPNHNEITSWYRYKQQSWHESGIPPSSKALNSSESLSVWNRADEAMRAMQKHAVVALCPDAPTAIREMNTLGSIINAYTMNLREQDDRSVDPDELYADFKQPVNSKYYSYADKEFLALYMNALTNYIIKDQADRINIRGYNNIDEVEGLHKFIMVQISKGVGEGEEDRNALNKKIYLPIVEKYLKENYDKFLKPVFTSRDILKPQEERNVLYWESYIKKYYPDEYKQVDIRTDGLIRQLFFGGITAYDRKMNMGRKEPPKIVGRLDPNNPWKNAGKE